MSVEFHDACDEKDFDSLASTPPQPVKIVNNRWFAFLDNSQPVFAARTILVNWFTELTGTIQNTTRQIRTLISKFIVPIAKNRTRMPTFICWMRFVIESIGFMNGLMPKVCVWIASVSVSESQFGRLMQVCINSEMESHVPASHRSFCTAERCVIVAT